MKLTLRSHVEATWGTSAWQTFIEDLSVESLELAPIKEGGPPPGLDERVDLSGGYEE